MVKKDGRVIAAENEVRVLRALHRFGWLRTRDLAALVWQHWQRRPLGDPSLVAANATGANLRMAQYTMRRLTRDRQVLRSRGPNGSVLYALAEAGARRLQQIGIPAATGKDIVRGFSTAHFRHRTIANEIAISGIVQGFRVSTEREIAQDRWLGGATGIVGKKPDVLLQSDGSLWWVEVEKSRKNAKDYGRLLNWLAQVGNDAALRTGSILLHPGTRWGKVIFVCVPAFEARVRTDLAAVGWKREQLDAFIFFSTTLYSLEETVFT